MIDIHTHIAFGLDDGAENIGEAVNMLQTAVSNGTDCVVLTPHFNSCRCACDFSKSELLSRLNHCKTELEQRISGIELLIGAEINCNDSIFDLIANDKIITLNGTNYVLVEFRYDVQFDFILRVADSFAERGMIAVIAHAERYDCLRRTPSRVAQLRKRGCLLQVNADSIVKSYSIGSDDFVGNLIAESLVDIVASDAHNIYIRTTDLSEAYTDVAVMHSVEYAELVFYKNPRKIIKTQR